MAAVGGSPIISGIIGVIVMGPRQRKEGLFKKWIVICMVGTLSFYFRVLVCYCYILSSLTHIQLGCCKFHFSLQLFLSDSFSPNHAIVRM